jgi:hypothetical protein
MVHSSEPFLMDHTRCLPTPIGFFTIAYHFMWPRKQF